MAGSTAAPQPRIAPFAGARPPVRPPPPTDRSDAVEPTTGGPADALPRRVPIRQPGRDDLRPGRQRTDGGTAPPATDPAESVFWLPIEEVHWDGTPIRQEPDLPRSPARRSGRRGSRRAQPAPLRGLAALVVLSLLASFFAWVSSGPFWLAMGHAQPGTVTINDCTGAGLSQRCRGDFTATDDRFVSHGVRVSGVTAQESASGTTLPARMTGADGGTAYVDTGRFALHLRWLLGLTLMLACTAGMVWASGATRLADQRARRWTIAATYAGPIMITAGFLAAGH